MVSMSANAVVAVPASDRSTIDACVEMIMSAISCRPPLILVPPCQVLRESTLISCAGLAPATEVLAPNVNALAVTVPAATAIALTIWRRVNPFIKSRLSLSCARTPGR